MRLLGLGTGGMKGMMLQYLDHLLIIYMVAHYQAGHISHS